VRCLPRDDSSITIEADLAFEEPKVVEKAAARRYRSMRRLRLRPSRCRVRSSKRNGNKSLITWSGRLKSPHQRKQVMEIHIDAKLGAVIDAEEER
jgi:hypothetical protein